MATCYIADETQRENDKRFNYAVNPKSACVRCNRVHHTWREKRAVTAVSQAHNTIKRPQGWTDFSTNQADPYIFQAQQSKTSGLLFLCWSASCYVILQNTTNCCLYTPRARFQGTAVSVPSLRKSRLTSINRLSLTCENLPTMCLEPAYERRYHRHAAVTTEPSVAVLPPPPPPPSHTPLRPWSCWSPGRCRRRNRSRSCDPGGTSYPLGAPSRLLMLTPTLDYDQCRGSSCACVRKKKKKKVIRHTKQIVSLFRSQQYHHGTAEEKEGDRKSRRHKIDTDVRYWGGEEGFCLSRSWLQPFRIFSRWLVFGPAATSGSTSSTRKLFAQEQPRDITTSRTTTGIV